MTQDTPKPGPKASPADKIEATPKPARKAASKRTVVPADWGRYPYGIEFKDLKKRAPGKLVALAAMTHAASLGTVAATGAVLAAGHVGMALGIAAMASLPLSLLYRGLECLVHGASHYDISDNHTWNDLMADLLMAWPVFQRTKSFRRIHLDQHHGNFAGESDPCRMRMQAHPDVASGDLPSLSKTLLGLPREMTQFYKTAGADPLTFVLGLAWHAAILVVPTALITGNPGLAAIAWAATFVPTYFLTLPAVRALAETGEHDYARLDDLSKSMVERTFDKTGFLNALIHLFGDQWHIAHHAYPGVPQYQLARLTKRMLAAGLGKVMMRRKTVLGKPEAYDAPPANDAAAPLSSNDNSTWS